MPTKQEDAGTIRALLEERRGLEQRGLVERIALVDRQLRALGHEAKTSQAKSVTRPSQRQAAKRG